MNLKPKYVEAQNGNPDFIASGKNLEWTIGNITLDSDDFEEGERVKAGTAVYRDGDFYKKVTDDVDADDMDGAVLTGYDVIVQSDDVNEHVPALKRGSVWEDLLHGVTDEFKKATQGRIMYDL